MNTKQKEETAPCQVTSYSNFEQNQHIRVIAQPDGVAWFVAKDVCRNLGLTNVSLAVKGNPKTGDRGLDADEIASIRIPDTSSSARNTITTLCVNESGMYALTFKSRKPQAIKFRKWVTSEVLPSLRKNGSYSMPGADPAPSTPVSLQELLAQLLNPETLRGIVQLAKTMTPRTPRATTAQMQVDEYNDGLHKLINSMTINKFYTLDQLLKHHLPGELKHITTRSMSAQRSILSTRLVRFIHSGHIHSHTGQHRKRFYTRPA